MALRAPETIVNAQSFSVSAVGTTIDLASVNGTGYALYSGAAIGALWTSGVLTPLDFTKAEVDATANTITTVAHHGLLTNDQVQWTTTGTVVKGAALLTDFWVIKVDDHVFKLASSSADALAGTAVNLVEDTHTLTPLTPVTKSFVDADVTVIGDNIAITGHAFVDGQKVRATTDGVLPTGLDLLTDYWVIVVNPNSLKLATSLANASAGTAKDITAAAGGGTHNIVPVTSAVKTFGDFDADQTADEITIPTHNFVDGQRVGLTTGGILPGGLAAGNNWVIVVDANTISLATSLALAAAGTADDITSAAGDGTHTLTATLAAAATVDIQHSLDGTNWYAVASGMGGASKDTTAVASNLWAYTGPCRYVRAYFSITGGQLTGVTVQCGGLAWSD